MEKNIILKTVKARINEAESDIKKLLNDIIDEDSLVEFSACSFSKSEFYDEDALGEGVLTGFATIADTPIYVVCQNSKVLSGGISKANCDKIINCLKKAESKSAPVLYLLDSKGVRLGEGVDVLEGIAGVLNEANALKGVAPQFAVCLGEVYGSFAVLAAIADFNFMLKSSCVSYGSPLVISAADGKNLPKEAIGGAKAQVASGITTFEVENLKEVRAKMCKLFSVMPDFGDFIDDNDDDLNRNAPELNEKVCAKCLIEAVADKDTFIELNEGFCPEVKCGFARIGGISGAVILFDGGNDGVKLNENNLRKIKEFIYIADSLELPVIDFVNTLGIENNIAASRSQVLREVGNVINALSFVEKISVVYGKAIGLGYSLFAAKQMGFDSTYAFSSAEIGLFDAAQGAAVELNASAADAEKLKARYTEENLNAVNAAKNGYVDGIIEPEFVRQYVIAALQMLVR